LIELQQCGTDSQLITEIDQNDKENEEAYADAFALLRRLSDQAGSTHKVKLKRVGKH
jgi:hypothetical protein